MKKVVLIILDGFGLGSPWGGNAVFMAKTPCFDHLWQTFPHAKLAASGEAVGLPANESGNSEAGHLNIGAGRVVFQDINHIFNLIKNGQFYQNQILIDAINHAKKNHSNLHLMGLVSDGGVHSHIDHLFALLEVCRRQKFNRVFVDAFLDGRDTEPEEALLFIEKLENKFKELGFGQISSISGRYYAMDRDNHWDRTKLAYKAMAEGVGPEVKNPIAAISQSYKNNLSDEFALPTIIHKAPIGNNDAIIFFNARGDRARQLTEAFTNPAFYKFLVKKKSNLYFVTFAWYGERREKVQFPFTPEQIENPLPKVFSDLKLRQLHIAETEKFAHVTYFFNGGRKEPFPHEDRLMIPSERVPKFDLIPEMSANRITRTVTSKIKLDHHSFYLINYANCDMVGHTGNFKAAVKAVECVDQQLKNILGICLNNDQYLTLITADHGNAEQMVNPTNGEIDTEHTQNPVPLIIGQKNPAKKIAEKGILADIAPTILDLIGIAMPKEMTGNSLLLKT